MIRVKGDDTTARRTIGRESRQAKKMREKMQGADACLTRPSQKASIPESRVKQGKPIQGRDDQRGKKWVNRMGRRTY